MEATETNRNVKQENDVATADSFTALQNNNFSSFMENNSNVENIISPSGDIVENCIFIFIAASGNMLVI